LRKNIEEATAAVEQEREKNVSLLHLIFPPDIAKRLWLGNDYYYYYYHILKLFHTLSFAALFIILYVLLLVVLVLT
jgi:hypothetical protein